MMEKSVVIAKIKKCANELNELADSLADVSNKPIALEDVRKVLAELSRDGLTEKVRQLLNKYGADKLSEIEPDNYEALLNDAKEISHDN